MLFPFSVAKWAKWIEAVQPEGSRDPIPLQRALRWIQLESAGNVCSVGRVGKPGEAHPGHVYEAGLAQTYFERPGEVNFGVTNDQLRAKCDGTKMPTNLTDADRLLHARVAIDTMKDQRARARKKLLLNGASLAEKSADFWCFVKLEHAAPALFSYLALAKRHIGRIPTWREFRRFVEGLSFESLRAVNAGIASRVWRLGTNGTRTRTDYLDRVFRNCEHFAGGAGGFVDLEMLAIIAFIAAIAIAFTRLGVV